MSLHHIDFRQKMVVMVAVMSGLFLVALDQTIIATALGKIVEEFQSFNSLSWIITAYMLTMTVTVPLSGKLSDQFGRRRLLLVGVAVFGLGSLLSGMAANVEQLIGFRALQGVGGGILMANAFTIIGDLFAPRERARWQGIIAAVFGSASVIGPLLGGFLTDPHSAFGLVTNWRWTLWINVPIGIVSFALIARYCPVIRHENKPRIDYKGAALLAALLTTIILAADNTEKIFADVLDSTGLSLAGLRLILGAVAVVLLAGFIWVERRAAEPVLPLGFFKNRNFSLIMSMAVLNGAAFLGAILYLTQFNQQVFGASASEAGLMLLPLVAGLGGTAAIGGQIVTRTGKYKAFLVGGYALSSVAIASLALLGPGSPYWHEAIMMFFTGMGLGVGLPIMNLAVQNEFDQSDLGVATASSQLFRSLGSTVGTAVFGGILMAGIAASLGDVTKDPYVTALSQNPQASQLVQGADANTALTLNTADVRSKISDGLERGLQDQPLPQSVKQSVIAKFESQQKAFSDKVVTAFSDSLRSVFVIAAALMATGTVISIFIKERELKTMSPDATPGIA